MHAGIPFQMRFVVTWCLLLQNIVSPVTGGAIPDNSVIWTANANGLFYLDHNDTNKWLFTQDPSGLTLRSVAISSAQNIVGLSYDYSTEQLIVSDPVFNLINLVNLESLSGSPFHLGASPGVGQLTIDWLARNVYWTDGSYGWIAMKAFPAATNTVNSFDRSFRVIVDTSLDNPTGIVVYPFQHYLFWADAGSKPKIERSDPVGGGRVVLVWQGLITPTCLSIDNNTDRLFWSDRARETIEYIYFNGTGRTIFVSETGYDFYGIAVFQNRIIYTAPGRNMSGVYSLDNALTGTKLNVGRPFYYVDVYDKDTQPRSPQEPCDSDHFDCQQICVDMEFDRGATCFCEDGYDLVQGNMCEANTTVLERHLLFTLNNTICATSINVIYSSQIPKPSTDCTVIQHDQTITKFAIDMNNDYIFFTDGDTVFKQLAFNSDTKTSLHTSSNEVLDIDFNWKTNELFWVESGNNKVFYKSTDNPGASPSLSPVSPVSPAVIKTLAVDPHNNHVYWISNDGSNHKLYDWNRGDNTVVGILTSALRNPSDLEYDQVNNRLMWNDDSYYGIIRPDGTRSQKIDTYPDTGTRHGIAVYKKLVLCTIQDGINHFDAYANEGNPPISVDVAGASLDDTIRDVHVFDSTTQLSILDACEIDNNGCHHFCFPGDTIQCACSLGYELAADGKACASTPLSDDFSLVLDVLNGRVFQFQTGVQPVDLRVVAMAPTNSPVAMAYDDARNTLTWVDGQSKSVRKMNILQNSETTLTGSDFLDSSVIALDVMTGNIYVTRDRKIYLINSTNGQKSTILDESDVQATIKSIAVSNSSIAWIEMGSQPKIMRSDLNGNDVKTVAAYDANRIQTPETIKFDPENGNIYWCDSGKDRIERVDNNLNPVIVYGSQFHNPVAFDVIDNHIYYIPKGKRRIFVINKMTGQEVSAVVEIPIIGALDSLHISRTVTLPTTSPAVTTTIPLNKDTITSSLPIVPIAAGAGGGVALIIIVIVVLVCCLRKRNEKNAMRRPSRLPQLSEITAAQNGRVHDYAGMGAASPDPPPRFDQNSLSPQPLDEDDHHYAGLGAASPDPPELAKKEVEEEIYDHLDEARMFVDLPDKSDRTDTSIANNRLSGRYSKFPVGSSYDESNINAGYHSDDHATGGVYLQNGDKGDYMTSISSQSFGNADQDGAVSIGDLSSPHNTRIKYSRKHSDNAEDYLQPQSSVKYHHAPIRESRGQSSRQHHDDGYRGSLNVATGFHVPPSPYNTQITNERNLPNDPDDYVHPRFTVNNADALFDQDDYLNPRFSMNNADALYDQDDYLNPRFSVKYADSVYDPHAGQQHNSSRYSDSNKRPDNFDLDQRQRNSNAWSENKGPSNDYERSISGGSPSMVDRRSHGSSHVGTNRSSTAGFGELSGSITTGNRPGPTPEGGTRSSSGYSTFIRNSDQLKV